MIYNGKELKIPSHIAIIMDGNGRWAKSRMLPVKMGHRAGAENLRKITDEAIALNINYLTAYAFSTENWKRSEQEVEALMDLMNSYLDKYTSDAEVKNTKVRIIGDISKLSPILIEKINKVQKVTENKTGLVLCIAINYGGRDEIVRAAKKIVSDAEKNVITTDSMDANVFSSYLDTAGIPDPDLLIRTSGELRISNFLLWQLAYAEMFFTNKLWPEFNKSDLITAIEAYNNKDRRYGGRA